MPSIMCASRLAGPSWSANAWQSLGEAPCALPEARAATGVVVEHIGVGYVVDARPGLLAASVAVYEDRPCTHMRGPRQQAARKTRRYTFRKMKHHAPSHGRRHRLDPLVPTWRRLAKQTILLADVALGHDAGPTDLLRIEEELARVNNELERCTSNASMLDLAFGVASGILAGAIDAACVGEAPLFGEGIKNEWDKVPELAGDLADRYGEIASSNRRRASTARAKARPASNSVWKRVASWAPGLRDQLNNMSVTPSPMGLAAMIAMHLLDSDALNDRDGTLSPRTLSDNKQDIYALLVPATMCGFLSWLTSLSMEPTDAEGADDIPEAIKRLAFMAGAIPMMGEVAACAERWYAGLARRGGIPRTKQGGLDMGEVFVSFLYELSELPALRQAGLANYLDLLRSEEMARIRQPLPSIDALGRQALPVMLNEVMVRMCYFLSRLSREFDSKGPSGEVSWDEVMPFGNRTVERMMSMASITLSVADTTDAAAHAAIESAGNWVLFSQKFVVRYNYVAAGRAALSVVREFSEEARELELLHERRLLAEAHSALVVERLERYREELSERVDAYVMDRLQVLMKSMAVMDQGLTGGDSDLVISGNVSIQQALGKHVQFTNADEFDALMESDEEFVF